MESLFWVYPGQLAGRPGPVFAPWNLEKLRDSGIDLVLSAATDLFPHTEAVKAGITRVCIPFPDVLPPDRHTLEICATNLRLSFELLNETIESGQTLMVNCAGGCDRTGLILARYIAYREGVSAADAIQQLRAIQPYALSAEGWEEMALQLITDELG